MYGVYINLLNISLINNRCFADTLLSVTDFVTLQAEAIVFDNNIIIHGTLFNVTQ